MWSPGCLACQLLRCIDVALVAQGADRGPVFLCRRGTMCPPPATGLLLGMHLLAQRQQGPQQRLALPQLQSKGERQQQRQGRLLL